MNWTQPLSAALIVLVAFWFGGAIGELFIMTFSIGPDTRSSIATIFLLTAVLLITIAVGARSRQWLKNPDAYW